MIGVNSSRRRLARNFWLITPNSNLVGGLLGSLKRKEGIFPSQGIKEGLRARESLKKPGKEFLGRLRGGLFKGFGRKKEGKVKGGKGVKVWEGKKESAFN